jgi:hypothetical protein
MKILSGVVTNINNDKFDKVVQITYRDWFWSKPKTRQVFRSVEAVYIDVALGWKVWYDGETGNRLTDRMCIKLDWFMAENQQAEHLHNMKKAIEYLKTKVK